MKKLILTALCISALIVGCEKETELIQPDCESIIAITTINGETTITLQSGKKVTAPTRKKVGEKYCYN